MRALRASFVAAAATVISLISSNAAAQPLCGANGHPVVYVAGTAKPYVTALAKALFTDPVPITIVFKGVTSCLGIDTIVSGAAISGGATYYDPASTKPNFEEPCTIDVPDGGTVNADIGASDVFYNTCVPMASGGLPKDVGDFFGPVASMTFVVPKVSTQTSISATAAYYVYGLGAAGHVAPWTDENWILKRNETSGTGLLIGKGLGLEPQKWKGFDPLFSGAMITKLSDVATPASTIGILAATEITQSISTSVTELAYKHFGQSCAYYPDSGLAAKDKINTRDGHYMLWGPYHFFTKIDPVTGNVRSANAQRVINYLTGTSKAPGSLDLIQVSAVNNLVPTCAMKVKRATEVGPLSSFAPPNACGCYFEKVATGNTSCTACTGNAGCSGATPVCSYGFCEAQ